MPPHQGMLQHHVVDVMARIALVACHIERPVDEHRHVGVDLDQALVVPLVPVVAGPRLPLHVFEGEGLAGRQLHVARGPLPAGRDRGLEDGVEFSRRDDEPFAPRGVARRHRPASREQRVQPAHDHLEMGFIAVRRGHTVERARFLVEAELGALEHVQPRRQGLELAGEIGLPERDQLGGVGKLDRPQGIQECRGAGPDLGQWHPGRIRCSFPCCGPVPGVHVIGVVGPDRQGQANVGLRDGVERIGHVRRSAAAGERQNRDACEEGAHGHVS